MHPITEKLKDSMIITGLSMIVGSFIFFLIPVYFPSSFNTSSGGMFMINFGITATYFLLLIFRGRLKRGRDGSYPLALFLILFLISAYSLNREMNIFEQSVSWLYAALIIVCLNYLSFPFFDLMPKWLKYLVCAVAGTAMVIFVYLAIYLLPIYAIGAAAFFALGISLHTFVPLLFGWYTLSLMKKVNNGPKKYWLPFSAGIAMPVVLVIVYLISWNNNLQAINSQFRYSTITENNELPSWIRVEQRMPKNDISEKILKTGLVYSVPETGDRNFFWRIPNLNFESKIHDPLVMISALLCGPVHVPEEKRIKILESMYDSRHQAEERLWSGKDLITEQVNTTVRLWPEYRLSYSELELIISHIADNSSWTSSQEAIYTFHVPEGGVVTSLSLWIEGKEEKGRLTTKAKADSAYKTIVGVEKRDPSVVHWQEGNTVTVRIFPVLRGESRKFKIGITAPLHYAQDKLTYENIRFKGPSAESAIEDIAIYGNNNASVNELPNDFKRNDGGRGISKTAKPYAPSWSLSIPAPPLSGKSFFFGNYSYRLEPLNSQQEIFHPDEIYLDINTSWTITECERVYQLARNRKVYVSAGEESVTELTPENREKLFGELTRNNFSLFPFYKIANDTSALVISKSSAFSPSIDDIKTSAFLQQTGEYFTQPRTIKLFNMGDELSPYLKSLKEFRTLQYDHGDEQRLQQILLTNRFIKNTESDNEIPVDGAAMSIHRADSAVNENAPDHLMRLFAYNHILQQSGRSLLKDTVNEEGVIEEAKKAYVVSPFSSLVVLETQKDYDRFDISSSKNSLQNASAKSKGAVPEPYEWALILIVIFFCLTAAIHPRFSINRRP